MKPKQIIDDAPLMEELVKRIDEINSQLTSTSPVSTLWDDLIREKQTCRVRLTAIKHRIEWQKNPHPVYMEVVRVLNDFGSKNRF